MNSLISDARTIVAIAGSGGGEADDIPRQLAGSVCDAIFNVKLGSGGNDGKKREEAAVIRSLAEMLKSWHRLIHH